MKNMVLCKKNKQIQNFVNMHVRIIVTKNNKFLRQPELSTVGKIVQSQSTKSNQNTCSKVPSSASQNVHIAQFTTFIKNKIKKRHREGKILYINLY